LPGPDEAVPAATVHASMGRMPSDSAVLRFWTRPLHAMTDAFTAAGFRITVISEPAVAPDTPSELLPADIGDGRRFLCFLFFVLHGRARRP
jgi:hypothetical protein